MKTIRRRHSLTIAASCGLFWLLAGAAAGEKPRDHAGPAAYDEDELSMGARPALTPDSILEKWPTRARAAAEAIIEKYGQPLQFNDDAMVWVNNGPWLRTIVYRRAWPRGSTGRDDEHLRQTIAYRVPKDKITSLLQFDKRLAVDQLNNTLSAQSGSENMNFLALNLADDIITEKKSVDEAREFYIKTSWLRSAGKSSPYLEGFVFVLPRAFPVTPVPMEE